MSLSAIQLWVQIFINIDNSVVLAQSYKLWFSSPPFRCFVITYFTSLSNVPLIYKAACESNHIQSSLAELLIDPNTMHKVI